ncbi:MAG TPA: GNAT family N-acetyltransferase [Vicinamibacteria bacterium]|nr:GNAT family N-acetyltransferase [Vicinamibacteria bacterium]
MPVPTPELALRLPDLPRLVETRAMLLSGACEVVGDTARGDYVVRSLENPLAAIVGRPAAAAVREAAARGGPVELLCGEDAVEGTVAALPGWCASPAAVHVLETQSPALARAAADVRLVGAEEPLFLSHLPGPLRQELAAARRRSPFAVAFDHDRAVSFAYAPWQTEALFDMSIDTLDGHRRRGLGAATAGLLIQHVLALGKRPVWGALEDNVASLRLAARLGFVPVDRIFVLSHEEDAE